MKSLSWLLTTLALTLLACAKDPAPRAAYEGAALVDLSPDCDPIELRDGDDRPCVRVERFAEGEGPEAARENWVRVHYIVELEDGRAAVDSSHDEKPLLFKLGVSNDVIEGVHLGVMGMRVGERRKVVVSPKLGYRGRKLPNIPPDANLVFFVELMAFSVPSS